MTKFDGLKIESKKLPSLKRKTVDTSPTGLIKTESLQPENSLPLVIQPAIKGVSLVSWANNNREFFEAQLLKYGGILFRNFNINGVSEFEQFIKNVSPNLLEYNERSSPRSCVTGNIYTSTDYRADQSIFLHNENSYQQTWPLKIFFFCITPAQQGGATTIADTRKVFARIDPNIRERFIKSGVMYVRNFGHGFGLPWQTVFQSQDKNVVEEYCRRNGIETEWKDNDCLKTRAIRQAVARHPHTGEMLWFNHLAFFNISTLETEIREALLAEFTEENLPHNTYYGDGSPIEIKFLDELREAYRQETIPVFWQQEDILMLDNMLVAHGRTPFVGLREIVVGMSEPTSNKNI
ncbi:TauD/TfdA family dioxygenase [Nostoc flagelliforme FACHB-838]|uniref:TauD/TfdA family dioxygenase n=1 Tax=Nostoc flagelliforme FACHB-838 TaxID=2692904 RepID=A0ABR8E233_9NOSO|nr:TauD/TfdA family dioxygenase [Nostoc flagelliforme]MBD2535167.1 TauD/TfdA family dioxygenase [Nostoc flagelliforme FACHB-838]